MKRSRGLRRLIRLAVPALVVAGVVQQLRRPPEERTWYGELLGFIPYDFRPPTPARFRESFWNPADPRLLTPRSFGVGWSVNFYQLYRRVMSVSAGGPAASPAA